MLWGSRAPSQAQASLRRELSNLAALMNDNDTPYLIIARDQVSLDLTRVTVDVLRPPTAAHRAIRHAEFLEGLDIVGEEAFEDWLRVQRVALGEQADVPPLDAPHAAHSLIKAYPLDPPAYGVRPSVAVLPFASSLSGADRLHLADALVEEISLSLSRYSSLFVIAGGSSLSYRANDSGREAIGRDLGVRYLVEGSVRFADGTIRATVKLVDSLTSAQVWADRFEDRRENFFDLQDRIADAVAARIDSSIEISERLKALARPVASPDGYHLYWQANALFRQWDRASIVKAITVCDELRRLEPGNAWAAALSAFCHSTLFSWGWSDDPEKTRAAAVAAYEHALKQGGDDPVVLGYVAGTLVGIGGDLSVACRLVQRALDLHPMSSSSLSWGGWIDVSMGNSERAIERLSLALRINPRSGVRPLLLCGLGLASLSTGAIEPAIVALVEANELLPRHPVTLGGLAVAFALAGRRDDAAVTVRQFHAINGMSTVIALIHDQSQRDMFLAGIALAESGAEPVAIDRSDQTPVIEGLAVEHRAR